MGVASLPLEPLRPFLRWAGSKRQLLPILSSYWSGNRNKYIEPFMGSACLYFFLRPACAVLGDTNGDLVETFELLRVQPKTIHSKLITLPRTERQYYKMRAMNPRRMQPINRAVRFIYLNRNCFNGLYRTNSQGRFNVPFSGSRTGAYPTQEEFCTLAGQLRGGVLERGDFDRIVRIHCERGDFVYLDPPFAVNNRRVFRQYGPDVFGMEDMDRLVRLLEYLDGIGAAFVLSYAESPEAEDRFTPWHIRHVRTRRNISGFARHRRSAGELLISNVEPSP